MRFNTFLSGFTVALAVIVTIISIAFGQGWLVTGNEASRQSMASLAFASIAYERDLYQGNTDANGCYSFPEDRRDRIQELVRDYALTEDDLIYSTESLLCLGWIIPYDL
jgi:hypothetical protein